MRLEGWEITPGHHAQIAFLRWRPAAESWSKALPTRERQTRQKNEQDRGRVSSHDRIRTRSFKSNP